MTRLLESDYNKYPAKYSIRTKHNKYACGNRFTSGYERGYEGGSTRTTQRKQR